MPPDVWDPKGGTRWLSFSWRSCCSHSPCLLYTSDAADEVLSVDLFAVGLQVVHALVLLHAPDLKQAPSALQAAAISQSMDRSYKTFTQAVTLGQEIKSEITELTGVSLNDLGHGELYCREDTDLTGVKVNDVTGKTQN